MASSNPDKAFLGLVGVGTMATYNQRKLESEVRQEVVDELDGFRGDKIAHLEDIRESLGFTMGRISKDLGENPSWYSNCYRGDMGHDFTISEYERVKRYLELERLRRATWLEISDINGNFGDGERKDWYLDKVQGDMQLEHYVKLRTFLELVVLSGYTDGFVEEEELVELTNLGIIDPSLAQDSIDLK